MKKCPPITPGLSTVHSHVSTHVQYVSLRTLSIGLAIVCAGVGSYLTEVSLG